MSERNSSILQNVATRERTILKNVYLWMTAGLGLTALVAFFVASNPSLLRALVGNTMGFLLIVVGQFALVFYLSARLDRMSQASAIGAFLAYSALNGIMLSTIFAVYAGVVIYKTFFTTALMFGGMSLYAMTTKRDLNKFGSYLVMGLWGLIIASLINMFLGSSGLDYLISFIGVGIFLGLTAWDTQKIIRMNEQYGSGIDEETFTKLSIIGALTLYLDFLNLFLFLLRIFGRSNNR
ncbi:MULTISPECIES: Bax inhibitor-1/YccA family protein [Sphaerochaeta]|jgi:FtsH-binding integral membrane protein|uniref:Bax inhibitor-1/YccA family protein n=1 Tax=Sphaerochaeta associata TaxID=1129264 RepID=A0ABY4DHH2_9SPIR|nr:MULTISPECIES: Bax inhibitor-1/YccA family protein [Sphaerochaeta]MDT3359833.1 Bax inhibitor-1/YccA family protein [Spirochaetota bacterium]NLA98684.1 Bax inhibitor-1/YccA family protein [Spirochaetales bacterium]MDD2394510.1 Bax inhibitor-1/YccA family protein [Sphaerochaeta sp.]MDD3425112.1 Bax inhibitor-1/YccA family protein [Sphaerochaeta sp.]MDD3457633.1 Bax inhibitor-1/YccA family protein [Sphaerochaeta sp.]